MSLQAEVVLETPHHQNIHNKFLLHDQMYVILESVFLDNFT